jgi:tRNA pseudouridine38-40 synthase
MNDEPMDEANARNIKLIIAYDGTDFSGWQIQNNARTVQGEIENALEKMHKKHIALSGAGRTDAGVHATSQCANFITTIKNITPERFMHALNNLLPRDIRIAASSEASDNFHARFSAEARSYRYYFIANRLALPHEARYAAQLWRIPSTSLLNQYTRLLHGELDCSLFASPSDPVFAKGSGSKYRNIHHALFFWENGKLIFEIKANAFFRKMVRSIIGTLLYYEEKETPPEIFNKILIEGRRENAGPTAIPNGLFLHAIDY